jgi:hypothetical protein
MSTTAAFFIRQGESAYFLGGHYSDGYIQEQEDVTRRGIPPSLLKSTTEKEFIRGVEKHMRKVSKDDKMETLTWAKAKGVQYIYCFFEGHVWVTNGGRWYNDCIPANIKPTWDTPSVPVCRKGKLSIAVVIECGQCQRQDKLDHKDFDTQPNGWPLPNLYSYLQDHGWELSQTQGWLCGECKQ